MYLCIVSISEWLHIWVSVRSMFIYATLKQCCQCHLEPPHLIVSAWMKLRSYDQRWSICCAQCGKTFLHKLQVVFYLYSTINNVLHCLIFENNNRSMWCSYPVYGDCPCGLSVAIIRRNIDPIPFFRVRDQTRDVDRNKLRNFARWKQVHPSFFFFDCLCRFQILHLNTDSCLTEAIWSLQYLPLRSSTIHLVSGCAAGVGTAHGTAKFFRIVSEQLFGPPR